MTIEIIEKERSYRVVGVAMEVHRKLGPGLDEVHYHNAILELLKTEGMHGRSKAKGKLMHHGQFADGFEADFLVEDSLVLELKHLDGNFCPEHYAQIISYLKHWNIRLGMLIDFGKESLSVERVVYDPPEIALSSSSLCEPLRASQDNQELFEVVGEALINVGNSYGLGYRDTTYNALVRIELQSLGLKTAKPVTPIRFNGQQLGTSELRCIVVNDTCVLCVHALQDRLRAADRAKAQTYLKHLGLAWGLLANFGKKQFETRYVTHN